MNPFLASLLTIVFSANCFSPVVPAAFYSQSAFHETKKETPNHAFPSAKHLFFPTLTPTPAETDSTPQPSSHETITAFNTRSEKIMPHVPEKAVEHSPILIPVSPTPQPARVEPSPTPTVVSEPNPTITHTPPIDIPKNPDPCNWNPRPENKTDATDERERLSYSIPCLH